MLNKLIEQAKNPTGIVGSFMLGIMNTAHTEMNKWALENTKISDESVLLDVGCGGGKTIQLLSQMNHYGKIYGIDYSEQAVKKSIRANKADVEKGKVHIQQASVTNIPFSESHFDLVTAFQTHYFWSDLESGVKEVFRVLKTDGCFLITAELYKINYHMEFFKTKEDIEQLLKKAGFDAIYFNEHANQKWICIKAKKG